jgi:hypothetical protein
VKFDVVSGDFAIRPAIRRHRWFDADCRVRRQRPAQGDQGDSNVHAAGNDSGDGGHDRESGNGPFTIVQTTNGAAVLSVIPATATIKTPPDLLHERLPRRLLHLRRHAALPGDIDLP